jgi:hypothetical protein
LVGYSAVAIAGFTFYADRTLGWEATKSPWIIAAVAIYFILNTFLTYWIWAVEAGEVYSGKRKTGETVCGSIFWPLAAVCSGTVLTIYNTDIGFVLGPEVLKSLQVARHL